MDVGNLISGFFAFSKTSLNIWKFTVHVLLKPGLENFEHTLLACEMSAIVRTVNSQEIPKFSFIFKGGMIMLLITKL